jgi:hypothetical protein
MDSNKKLVTVKPAFPGDDAFMREMGLVMAIIVNGCICIMFSHSGIFEKGGGEKLCCLFSLKEKLEHSSY